MPHVFFCKVIIWTGQSLPQGVSDWLVCLWCHRVIGAALFILPPDLRQPAIFILRTEVTKTLFVKKASDKLMMLY